MLGKVVAESDVVITTAVVPGKKSPVLVTEEMVAGMAPGSVIVDLAAERGGNCELTQPGEIIVVTRRDHHRLHQPASTVPYHASQMYAKNLTRFLVHLVKDGKLQMNLEDEIMREHVGYARRRDRECRACASSSRCPRWQQPQGGHVVVTHRPHQQPVRIHAGGLHRL